MQAPPLVQLRRRQEDEVQQQLEQAEAAVERPGHSAQRRLAIESRAKQASMDGCHRSQEA